jgi:6-phosphogluconolactonase
MKTKSHPKSHPKLLIALAFVLIALAAPAKEFWVYFGNETDTPGGGIYVSRLDVDTGKLSPPELAVTTVNPGFLAVAPGGKFLYAGNRMDNFNGERGGAVSAFAVDPASGHLTLLNQKSSHGDGPCHLSVDATGNVLLVANYTSGSLQTFRLNPDGSLGADASHVQHLGSSVNPSRQSSPHAHFICADPSNRFALACDLGLDKVMIYQLNPKDGTLTTNSSASVPPGSGSRHLAFSRDGKFAHVLNEMGCTVTTLAWDAAAGELAPIETVSALPPDVAVQPNFTAAEILTSGNHIYATIRGHDSVTVFNADPQTGRLTFAQNVSSGGKVPRGLGIDPTGRWLIAANQNTGNAVEFAIDPGTGKLSPTGQELKTASAMDVKFVEKN